MMTGPLREQRLDLARRSADRLAAIDGVTAVVVGGSVARGDADASSDLDLGLYYDGARPLDVTALRALAREMDDRHPADAVTDIGGWGAWMNGGGWLVIEECRVDWLYRDLSLVTRVIADCQAGRYTPHYQPGHPHAFHTHMLMGEVYHARPLVDPSGAFAALQRRTDVYPPALRSAVMRGNTWEAGFALETTAKAVARNDVFQVTGSLFRATACLIQALFARNERYFINEKRALDIVDTFAARPEGFAPTVRAVLAAPGGTPEALAASVARMQDLVAATRELCAES